MAKRKSQKSKKEKQKENIKQLDIEVGSRFRELRKANGLTQEQMAEAMGKSVATIYNYEKGITRIPDEIKIALVELYQISIDELLIGPGAKLEMVIERDVRSFSNYRLEVYNRIVTGEVSRRLLEKEE